MGDVINQIWELVGEVINQSTIWEFVGGVSAIIGLVCFGLSSTYDMTFGKLGSGGPLIYLFVWSFMWWLMIWGKRIQVSEKFMIWGKRIKVSEKFKGVVGAILFVVICSISVVYEKYVPEKSDAYTITSYGLFALMSVSLSRKLELGFETGFFAFFLKLFATQLLKIKWFLLPIALVFCSLVIILYHYPESRVIRVGDEKSQYSQQEATNNQKNNEAESSQAASQDSTDMGKVSGQGLLSTSKERNSQEKSSQATLHSPSNYGQISEENIPDKEDSEENNEPEEDDPPSVPFKDQVSSENKMRSSAEPEFISAAATGLRRRPTNIQNKQEEDSTSSSLAPKMTSSPQSSDGSKLMMEKVKKSLRRFAEIVGLAADTSHVPSITSDSNMFAVCKFDFKNNRTKQKALKVVSGIPGIYSISMDMNQKKLTVMGTFDPIVVLSKLRKFCPIDVVSVGQVEEPEKKEEPEKEDIDLIYLT